VIEFQSKAPYYLFSYAAAAFIIALLATPLVRPLAFRLRAVDRGSRRRAHKGVIPRLGGIAIYLALVIPLLTMIATSPHSGFNDKLLSIILAGTLVFVVGVYDDIKALPVKVKLGIESAAAVLLFFLGLRINTLTNPFGGSIDLDLLSLPVTVLWILVICNAINLIDGLDGLAAGTGILVGAMLFLMSGERSAEQSLVPLVIAAGLFGFLRHNFPPATIFMGDSGSLFLGFFLAGSSILYSSKATAMATMMVPVVAFAHPIMDMGYAVIRRLYRGVPLGQPDREHIHHKLLDMGLSRKLVLAVLISANALLMLAAWLIVQRQRRSDFFLLALLVAAFVAGSRLFRYVEFSRPFRADFMVLMMNRERRYTLFLVRGFRKHSAAAASIEDLKPQIMLLLEETGFEAVFVTLRFPGMEEQEIVFGGKLVPGTGVRTSFPVIRSGGEVGRCDLVAAAGRNSSVDAAEVAAAVSDAVLAVVKTE